MTPAPAVLDGPPPSPANPPGGDLSALLPQAPQQAPQESPNKALVAMGAEIDRALAAILDAAGTSTELAQARQLIKVGLAKILAASPTGDTAASPTSAGSQFPGAAPTPGGALL